MDVHVIIVAVVCGVAVTLTICLIEGFDKVAKSQNNLERKLDDLEKKLDDQFSSLGENGC